MASPVFASHQAARAADHVSCSKTCPGRQALRASNGATQAISVRERMGRRSHGDRRSVRTAFQSLALNMHRRRHPIVPCMALDKFGQQATSGRTTGSGISVLPSSWGDRGHRVVLLPEASLGRPGEHDLSALLRKPRSQRIGCTVRNTPARIPKPVVAQSQPHARLG